jgi:hypothetical protein
MRTLGTYVLTASFLLRAGTSNDLAGQRITDFAYTYGFMPLGAILLYVVFAAMLWVWRPPGIGAEDSKAKSRPVRQSLMRWRTAPD